MRPLARRRAIMARPPRVLMRARKPSLRARGRFLGCQVRFIVFIPPSGSSHCTHRGELQKTDVFDWDCDFASKKRQCSITPQKSFANPLKSPAVRFKIKGPVCALCCRAARLAARTPRPHAVTFLRYTVEINRCLIFISCTRFALTLPHRSRANRPSVCAESVSFNLYTGMENPVDNS